MRLSGKISVNWTLSLLLLAGSPLAVSAIGCGDDDTEGTDGTSAGSGGDAAGSGGGAAGSGGESTAGTGDPKQDTCQCYIDLGMIPQDDAMKAECVSNVSDACVACTEGIAAGATCSGLLEADFNDCAADCGGLIAPPETSQECRDMIGVFGDSPVEASVTDCFCDNCLDAFAPCMVHRGCMSIILCMGERQCDTAECLADEVCGPLFTEVEAVYPGTVADLLLPISVCNNTNLCRPNPALTAGTGGAGGAGGAGGTGGAGGAG